MKDKESSRTPLIFGETLFDIFPDGKLILGGAPFNVTWHLQGFGLTPLLITRIGCDALGEQGFQAMQKWGINTQQVQRDTVYPTGTVKVLTQQGSHHFDIPAHQAYDHITIEPVLKTLTEIPCCLLYHGTLALRHHVSRQTLHTLAQTLKLPIFLDINLRHPWWNQQLLETYLKAATWVKANEEEMSIIEPKFRTFIEKGNFKESERVLENFCHRYNILMLIVTLGKRGALFKTIQGDFLYLPAPKITMVDSVGAGDAFSAAVIEGLIRYLSPFSILEQAITFAAAICEIQGATNLDKSLYELKNDRQPSKIDCEPS